MQRFCLLLLLLGMVTQLKARNLSVHVTDIQEGKPLSGANIVYSFAEKDLRTFTDEKGIATLQTVQFPLQLKISYLGYESIDTILKDLPPGMDQIEIALSIKNKQLNDVIVTGGIVPVMERNSIYKVKSIPQKEIQNRAALGLGDVLQFEMNHFLSSDNILGTGLNIGGLSGQNIKMLINGVPINGSEAGFIDLSQINMHNVRRIEILQGPMSIIYGGNAMGGVINIITGETKNTWEGNLKAYGESIGKLNIAGSVGFKKRQHRFKLSMVENDFFGWSPKEDTLERYQLWKPKQQRSADINYNYSLKKGDIDFYTYYLYETIQNLGAPNVSPYRAYAFDEYYKTNRFRQSVNFNHRLSPFERFSMQNTYSVYYRTKNRFLKDLVNLDSELTSNIEDQDTSVYDMWHFRGMFNSNRIRSVDLNAGYELNMEKGVSSRLLDNKQKINETGFFTTATYMHKSVSLMPSFRINFHSKYHTNYSYGLHTKYTPNHRLNIRASLAQAYRSPGMKEMFLTFIDNNHIITGNENLLPEKGHHLQLFADYTIQNNKTLWTLSYEGRLNRIKNMIHLVNDSTNFISARYINLNSFNNVIHSLIVHYQQNHLQFKTAFSITNIFNSTSYADQTIYEIGSSANYFWTKLNSHINLYYKFISRQPILFIDGTVAYSRPLHIANLTCSRSFLNNRITLQSGIKNIFNVYNNFLSSTQNVQTTAHGGEGNMTLLLPRSYFLSILYNL